jgi:hypothetical protein
VNRILKEVSRAQGEGQLGFTEGKYIMEALDPITKIPKYKAFQHGVIREFRSLF